MLDKWGGSEITHLHAFADSLSLEEIYRVKNPSELLFTWFNGPHGRLPFESLSYPQRVEITSA